MKLGNLKNSNTFRVFFIGILILLLLIPMGMVENVINERGQLYRQANNEITASWGREQLLIGPILTLPYLSSHTENGVWSYDTVYKHVHPSTMSINVQIETETRYRSIYKVPVYTAIVHIHGEFNLADEFAEEMDTTEYDIDEGFIQIPLGNPRTIKDTVIFSWDDEEVNLLPRWHEQANDGVSLSAELPAAKLDKGTVHHFEMVLKLAGSSDLNFVSLSRDTDINVSGNWGSPGFSGVYLPHSYTIEDESFIAKWEINDLLSAMGYEKSQWISSSWFVKQYQFGIRLVQPVDTYQLITRAAKYSVLFISLTFLVYFFIEVMSRISLHMAQYLLVGGANCLFYLLLLSLSEHINFNLAYLISSLASILLISFYSISILESRVKALLIFLMLSGLYTYLFVTLRSEDFAYLIGSIGLFSVLALVMFLTRNIDWNKALPAA